MYIYYYIYIYYIYIICITIYVSASLSFLLPQHALTLPHILSKLFTTVPTCSFSIVEDFFSPPSPPSPSRDTPLQLPLSHHTTPTPTLYPGAPMEPSLSTLMPPPSHRRCWQNRQGVAVVWQRYVGSVQQCRLYTSYKNGFWPTYIHK